MMIMKNTISLLEQIDTPAQLRTLSEEQLPLLADELREFLINTVSRIGGHFSSNLGTVELTIALHYVFNTPDDRVVWDVGHQSYPHKILTGRRDKMHTIRQLNGLSGFPKRTESEYDTFGVGHSSTSISAALGMAIAAKLAGVNRKVMAIIGDGALTAGMAFEALEHAGDVDANLLVILNDNDMSISPNVGGLSNYLAKILSSRFYTSVREGSKQLLQRMPTVRELARRAEEHVKGMVIPGTLFEELGFNYIGPIDGHDLSALIPTLRNMKALDGPQFLHVVTKKGKGYPIAEDNPCTYHGVTAFDPKTGKMAKKSASAPSYTQIFGQWLCDMATQDNKLVGITPAMREGSGLVDFSEKFPDRYFDVSIAEQHSVTLAAGLACEGYKPVVAIYSTFLQRAYDQLLHDVALQKLPVLFAIDRAGLVGADGATHAGTFDIAFMRCIPNMVIMTPADENECRQMLTTGFLHQEAPCAVRYPRGNGIGISVDQALTALPIGKAELRRQGHKVALLVFGTLLQVAAEAAEQLDATVVNMRFVKPLDNDMILNIAQQHDLIVTIEEGCIMGGAGSAVSEYLHTQAIVIPVLQLGLPDSFLEHGTQAQMLADCGLDVVGIVRSVTRRLSLIQPANYLTNVSVVGKSK
ncbi:1-deoxy-D-xylulose-5-phosphate synthase [Beggiatoa leptomitoformis]|uniref:1-deoxy-D-xylulose-5-phosphate synthase n=1 Tax=Beggiatoa leptomitoformis TaxID=288004 RepID=A0A2N9YAX1_9GAMM|nr:1-deoxy-D-xylulose-5-phosphate synthase [Beggiatoa leptomitoformis]AUI67600.1 1-deoxy-D-xylulose-5-phosphate synthase [Beggiatoa leptomitoformis]QGX03527.1 1-deoxy-D-xylulose-5-phosphate synthase [Beggiatoa leptomitoformis]